MCIRDRDTIICKLLRRLVINFVEVVDATAALTGVAAINVEAEKLHPLLMLWFATEELKYLKNLNLVMTTKVISIYGR